MKIGRINLSNPLSLAETKKPNAGEELGTAGSSAAPSLFGDEVITAFDKLKPEDFIKMRQQDGTASALYNVLTLPILSNDWTIEPEDDTPEAQTQADFVENALKLPPYKGGMTTPFDLVLADMLRAVLEGWRAFEKVFQITPDGKFTYRKIASRDSSTVTLLQDDRGGFNGFKQMAYIGKEYKTVTITQPYAFLFTFGKEKNWLKGESAFRAAYYHYEKKHRLYYVAHQAIQFGAIPPKTVKAPKGAKQNQIDAHVALADQLGFSSSIGLPDGWDLTPYEAGKGRIDPMGLIDHHNSEMARSILAQFIMLGSSGTTGSWALSQDQSDMFVIALRGLMSNIEEHITSYLLPDLVEYNFASPKYPRFVFANMTDATTTLLKEVALKVLDKRSEGIPEAMVKGIVDKLALQLDIELPDEKKSTDITNDQAVAIETAGAEIQKQALNGAQIASLLAIVQQVVLGQMPYDTAQETMKVSFPMLDDATIEKILGPAKDFTPDATADTKVTQSRATKFMTQLSESTRRHRHFLADNRWKRQLTPAENKVNFSALETKQNTLEEAFIEKAKPLFDQARQDALDEISALLKAKEYDKLESYTVTLPEAYRKLILDEMIDAYGFAKNGAADELNVPSPTTPPQTKDTIKQQANQIVEKQAADLTFEIKKTITEALRKNQLSEPERKGKTGRVYLDIADVLGTITGLWGAFYDSKITATAGVIIAQAINAGRDDVFSSNKSKISKYQYSAILDDVTCAICEDLDGSVVSEEEYANTQWLPPIHFSCRCIWVAVLSDEEDQPNDTGFPDEPGGITEPTLSEHYHGTCLSRIKVGE